MEKEKKVQPKNGRALTLDVRCRNCIFFKNGAAKAYGDKCINLGVLPYAKPCKYFTVDPYAVDYRKELFLSLIKLMSQLPSRRLPLIAALFNQEIRTRQAGFEFGQELYVRVFPEEYLSNYAKVFVVDADKRNKTVFVQGNDGWHGTFYFSTVLKEDQFGKKREKLQKARKFIDPNLKDYTTWKPVSKLMLKVDYEPPTIDQLESGKNNKANKHAKKRRPEVDEVIARQIRSG